MYAWRAECLSSTAEMPPTKPIVHHQYDELCWPLYASYPSIHPQSPTNNHPSFLAILSLDPHPNPSILTPVAQNETPLPPSPNQSRTPLQPLHSSRYPNKRWPRTPYLVMTFPNWRRAVRDTMNM